MTETLPTRKEADFNDVLAGFKRFGYCDIGVPDDLENLKHYCEALAFTVSSDLMDLQSRFQGRDFAMNRNDDFQKAQSMAYSLQHVTARLLALCQIGVQAAFHLEELEAKATPGEAS